MSRLLRLLTLIAAPLLDAFAIFRRWWARSASPRYFLASADYPGYLERGDAAAFCLYHARRYCQGRGIDVGAGRFPFPGARAIEDRPEENAYRLAEADQSLDYVFSSHCLEHLTHWQDALIEWHRVLKSGGILYLYLPHPACQMWRPECLHHHVWQPEPDCLASHLEGMGFELIEGSLFPDAYLSFYLVARSHTKGHPCKTTGEGA
ncbi:MAG: methyltransferase domain-containing protein [Pseudomonadota bacterium]